MRTKGLDVKVGQDLSFKTWILKMDLNLQITMADVAFDITEKHFLGIN